MAETSIFENLNKVDVSKWIEKKNGLSYVSWANAWAEVKKRYPNATYTIYEREHPQYGAINYFTDGNTCWVKTGVTIEGLEHIEELPVMDFRNKSIPLDKVTSFDVNKTIQRSLTKALARHGLGLYIYAGEDLPESDSEEKPTPKGNPNARPKAPKKISKAQCTELTQLATAAGADMMQFFAYFGKPSIDEFTVDDFEKARNMLNKKISSMKG